MENFNLRYDGKQHISVSCLEDEFVRVLRLRSHSRYVPPPEIVEYLKYAGFGHLVNNIQFTLNPALICALLERWRPETHTFHFHTGETAPTLEDVALHLGLPIDGEVVTGFGSGQNWSYLCERCFGVVPPSNILSAGKGNIKFAWLKDNFQTIPPGATHEDILYAARAWILHLIGAVLMPDTTGNHVHLMFLNLLEDFSKIPTFSWGSAVLAFLYREMCNATQHKYQSIGGCLPLLQSWAYYRMPFLIPVRNNLPPMTFPVINRWNFAPKYQGRYTLLQTYRAMLDTFNANEFVWMPYNSPDLVVPEEILRFRDLWRVNSALICFCTVEWQHGDRVMRQFGYQQDLPMTPQNLDKLHEQDMRGHEDQNWESVRMAWVNIWRTRWDRIPQSIYVGPGCGATTAYMQYFMNFGKPYLLPRNAPISPQYPERRRPPHRPRQRSEGHQHSGSTSAAAVHESPQVSAPLSVDDFALCTMAIRSDNTSFDLNVPLHDPYVDLSTEVYRPEMPGTSYGAESYVHPPYSQVSYTEEFMPSFEDLMTGTNFESPINTFPVQGNDEEYTPLQQYEHPQRNRRPPNRFTPRTTPSNHQMQ